MPKKQQNSSMVWYQPLFHSIITQSSYTRQSMTAAIIRSPSSDSRVIIQRHLTQLHIRHRTFLVRHANSLMTILRPELEVEFVPYTLESDCRMQDGETARSKNYHDTFEDHEERFVAGEEVAVETA
jgi:hypothetical protein